MIEASEEQLSLIPELSDAQRNSLRKDPAIIDILIARMVDTEREITQQLVACEILSPAHTYVMMNAQSKIRAAKWMQEQLAGLKKELER
jgi:hypothetical protein